MYRVFRTSYLGNGLPAPVTLPLPPRTLSTLCIRQSVVKIEGTQLGATEQGLKGSPVRFPVSSDARRAPCEPVSGTRIETTNRRDSRSVRRWVTVRRGVAARPTCHGGRDVPGKGLPRGRARESTDRGSKGHSRFEAAVDPRRVADTVGCPTVVDPRRSEDATRQPFGVAQFHLPRVRVD